jgi:hypothetical protein
MVIIGLLFLFMWHGLTVLGTTGVEYWITQDPASAKDVDKCVIDEDPTCSDSKTLDQIPANSSAHTYVSLRYLTAMHPYTEISMQYYNIEVGQLWCTK